MCVCVLVRHTNTVKSRANALTLFGHSDNAKFMRALSHNPNNTHTHTHTFNSI